MSNTFADYDEVYTDDVKEKKIFETRPRARVCVCACVRFHLGGGEQTALGIGTYYIIVYSPYATTSYYVPMCLYT
jgi:hypothetical protein